ncbi:hypothetical protein [Anabaena azotica]|uniref:hypothetical protein n=1 Tax=Anabaena azotica TaxID=197653 RepID=UPI0039A69683
MKLSRILPLVVGGAVAGMVVSGASPAQALTWNLNNVQFQDGATATGSFDYNATTSTYSNVSITLSNGTIYSSRSFNTSNLNFVQPYRFSLCSNGSGCFSSQYLYLIFSSNLTNTPGTLSVIGHSYGLTNTSGIISSSSALVGGTLSSAAVPFDIPGGATIPTFGSLFALALMRQVKKRLVAKTLIVNPVETVV